MYIVDFIQHAVQAVLNNQQWQQLKDRFPSIKMGQKSGTNTTGKEAGEAKDAPVDGKPGNAASGNGTSSDKSGNSDGKGEGEEDDEFHDTHDTVVTANDPARRRAPRKKPGVASALETADDDKYDDAWLPKYDDGPANEKVVDGEWVAVKKPKPTR
ncbi:hypothetical protein KHU50_002702 [Colletotrichum sp. SAR 10_65]|nr:hypothetical protein KHU50_002702 [Colletotrichum sp. SAR 10_65]